MKRANITAKTACAMRLGMLATLTLGACSAQNVAPDAAELANISAFKMVPKSSPRQLVLAFDRFCVNRKDTLAAQDDALRAAGYVPVAAAPNATARTYVVDSDRPAIAMSERMCVVRARSRTGQTDRFETYIADTFEQARSLPPAAFGRRIEKAWQLNDQPARVIATERSSQLGWYTYSLIHYEAQTS